MYINIEEDTISIYIILPFNWISLIVEEIN